MTLFDHLNNIYINKANWDDLTDQDKKTWNTFMVHKYISMLGKSECQLVNMIQQYTKLEPKIVYNFYKSYFSPRKRFAKYIKGSKEAKSNADLINILAEHYEISKREATEYIDLISKTELTTMLENLGYELTQIKKLLK